MNILDNLKAEFIKFMESPVIKFATNTITLTTTDGKSLIVIGDSVAVGAEIYELNADNTQTKLADGEYTTSDSQTITVASDPKDETKSVITEIADAKAETAENETMATDTNAPATETAPASTDTTDLQSQLDSMKADIDALKASVQELVDMMSGSMAKQNEIKMASEETITKLNFKIQELEKQPSAPKPSLIKPIETNVGVSAVHEKFFESMKAAKSAGI